MRWRAPTLTQKMLSIFGIVAKGDEAIWQLNALQDSEPWLGQGYSQ